MIATLTFNLPEESIEHRLALDGYKWRTAMHDLEHHFRDKIKYGHEFASADDVLEFARNSIYDFMSEEGLSFN